METRLPKLVDPARLATKRETLSGSLQADNISRLGTLYDIESPVEVVLDFVGDGPGKVAISGNLSTVLEAQCQRCLQAVSVSVSHEIALKVVDTEYFGAKNAAMQLEASDDAVEYRSKFDIHELIEDELILASPIVPLHKANDCAVPDNDLNTDKSVGTEVAPTADKISDAAAQPLERSMGERKADNGTNRSGKTTRPFEGLADLLSAEK